VDLKATGKEFDCAQAIDTLQDVKYLIRNNLYISERKEPLN
jgi:hypothetical protein